MRNGQQLTNSSLVTLTEESTSYIGLNFKQSYLQLCSVDLADSGSYTCVIGDGLATVNSGVYLNVVGEELSIVELSLQ